MFREHWPSSAEVYLPGGQVPAPGSRFSNPQLAATYQRVLDEAEAASPGRDEQIEAARRIFYEGFVAEASSATWTPPRSWTRRPPQPGPARLRRPRRLAAWHRGAAHLRLRRADRLQDAALGPGAGLPAAARAAGRVRPGRDGAGQRRLHPHRHRMRQAGVRGPGGLVRRPGVHRCPGSRRCCHPAIRTSGAAWWGTTSRLARRPVRRLRPPQSRGRTPNRARAARGRGGRRRDRTRADGAGAGAGHLPRGCRRPVREPGLGHPERRLAAVLPGDSRARLLPRLTHGDPAAPAGLRLSPVRSYERHRIRPDAGLRRERGSGAGAAAACSTPPPTPAACRATPSAADAARPARSEWPVQALEHGVVANVQGGEFEAFHLGGRRDQVVPEPNARM